MGVPPPPPPPPHRAMSLLHGELAPVFSVFPSLSCPQHRRLVRQQAAQRYISRVESKHALQERREINKDAFDNDEDVDSVFHTITQSDIDKKAAAGKGRK